MSKKTGKSARKANVNRNTKETKIDAEINLEGTGISSIKTPIGFLNHMLELFSKHSTFDLNINADGDLEVDQHHLVEDLGICIGQAVKAALGDKKGINRSGYFAYPMDEALALVAVDISGRPNLKLKAKFKRRFCGDLDTDLIEDFFKGFVDNAGVTLHIIMPYGRNDHHKIEAIFKAFAKALRMACSEDKKIFGIVPSTKGMI